MSEVVRRKIRDVERSRGTGRGWRQRGRRQGKEQWNQTGVLVSKKKPRSHRSDVGRTPRNYVTLEHMTLCHSCWGLSEPQRQASSTITLTGRDGRTHCPPIDKKAEACSIGLIHQGHPAVTGQHWPHASILIQALPPPSHLSVKEASPAGKKTLRSSPPLFWFNLIF